MFCRFLQIFRARSGAGVTPDWVHSETLPRFAGAMENLGSSNSAPNGPSSSMLRAAPQQQQQRVPNLDSWGIVQREGSSAGGHSWLPQPSSNLTGWSGTGGPPPSEAMPAANAPSQVAALGDIGGAVAAHPYFPVATATTTAARENAGVTLLTTATPRNGNGSTQQASSYLSGTTFESSDEPRMVGVDGQVEVGLDGARPPPSETAPIFLSSPSPPQGGGAAGDVSLLSATTPPAPPPSRPAPKKKPPRVRAPKKKAKAPVAPVRRTLKVKKRHPPEVPLGAKGRERAMALLRLLVNSPLSEEFQRPVIQMHPEVRTVVVVVQQSVVLG